MEITISNLRKSYDDRQVLDVKEGRVRSGSRTAIVGPNGAGKSTLLKIIAGLESPDEGAVLYDGNNQFPQMDVTLVFQKPYLISSTVEKNIAYPMKLRGFSPEQVENRITELTEELNLSGFRKQKSWKLSGGETQKVALARALSFRPKLLLLDEPTANIDPYTTSEIERMLLSITDTTIIMVTHNLAQAKRVCDDIIMLHEGQIVETGRAAEVLTAPKSEKARRFIEGELLI
ncbi:MAG: ATP-binding cassette domain-containing protein [Lentihominibacter sp.]|nr:ATP-binding cassette domain-containing protein [Lentihominibacter sp.]